MTQTKFAGGEVANGWAFDILSQNKCITWEIVKSNPHLPWSFSGLSQNPNITWDNVCDEPEEDWDYHSLSEHPNITIDIIKANSHLDWRMRNLSKNPNITVDNVNIVKKGLLVMYRYYWEDEDMDWLINDIISYSNGYHATMYGYVDKFYNIFLRHISLENILQVEKYMRSLERKEVTSQINILLGLMTLEERNELVKVTIEDFDSHSIEYTI